MCCCQYCENNVDDVGECCEQLCLLVVDVEECVGECGVLYLQWWFFKIFQGVVLDGYLVIGDEYFVCDFSVVVFVGGDQVLVVQCVELDGQECSSQELKGGVVLGQGGCLSGVVDWYVVRCV